MNIKQLILSIIVTFFGFSSTFAQSDYEKGWEEFLNNNRANAKILFTQASKEEATKADALLSLSLLDWSNGNKESAFSNFEKFYKASSKPDAYLLGAYTLPFNFISREYTEKNKLDFLESIVNKPDLNGTLKAMINSTLAYHYTYTKNPAKANQLLSKLGGIKEWQILGGFENTSGSGFNKDWGVVENSSPDKVYLNKERAEIKWFNPSAFKPDYWLYYSYFLYSGKSIYYSQSFINSPVDQEVYLRIGVSGSLKTWVNDALILSVEKELNCDLDIYAKKVKLNKGSNRILLQIGEGEIDEANFIVRVTDKNANPVEGLSFSANNAEYKKSTEKYDTESLPFFAEKFLKEEITKNPKNILNSIILAETYLRSDKTDAAIELLEGLKEKFPKSSFLDYRLYEGYLRGDNQTYATREQENMKLNDPESFYSLESEASEMIQSSKIPEVKKIRDKMVNLYGEKDETRYLDFWLAIVQNNEAEYANSIKSDYNRYPYKWERVNPMFFFEDVKMKRSKVATKILEDFNSKYFNPTALDKLAERYIKNGNTKKGFAIMESRIKSMPYASGLMYSYASTLFKMQKYTEALEIANNLLKLSPYLPSTYSLRADIYKAMNDNKQAIENYKKDIHYSPANFQARKQLRLLGDMKEMEDLFPKNDLPSLIAEAGTQSDYPEDHSLILLYDIQLLVFKEGAYETRTQLAVKILNQTGIEAWKEYYAPSSTLDKAEVIKANGQKVKAETSSGQIVFTNLEVGDVLNLDYRKKTYSSGALSANFASYSPLQFTVPSVVTKFSILIPEENGLDFVFRNGDVKPQISTMDDMKLYKWELSNQEAIKEEPLMHETNSLAPLVIYGNIPNWKVVSNWYRGVTTNKIEPDYLLRKTLAEILKGKEKASNMEKAELFYNYIANNITYSNVPFMQNNYIPQKASRTISTRLGDCKDVSTLFVTLCREVGIKANLVLVLTRDNNGELLELPSINFNHCIAQIEEDGKTYYLELTDNKLPFGAVLDMDLKASILPIPYRNEINTTDKPLEMNMPFRKVNEINRITKLEFDGLNTNTEMQVGFSGAFASYMRHTYKDLGKEERLKNMTQTISNEYEMSVKVSDLEFKDLDNLTNTSSYKLNIRSDGTVQQAAGMGIFKLKWVDNLGKLDVLALEERKFPFVLWGMLYGDKYTEEISIVLPNKKKLVEIPKDVKLECPSISYNLSYNTSTPGMVKVKRVLTMKKGYVYPDEYKEFREVMYSINENDNKQYVIK